MDTMIAFCGLDCAACPAYQATQANDQDWLERITTQWRVEFNAPDMTAASILCDGCAATTGRLSGYCGMCEVRASALERASPTPAAARSIRQEKIVQVEARLHLYYFFLSNGSSSRRSR